jgi:iron complex outermembrane receptor protein
MRIKQLAYAIGMIGFVGSMGFAVAADDVQKVDKIEVTGSSIKRIAKEGALPVQVVTRDEIVKSGVSSVADLIAQLPAMQGFTSAADSVGGTGGGVQTASLHDLGSEYTLVLLNGRRLAPSGSGSQVDLNSIPLSAIERVEVLTDGASAIYGSDAIAGVVNFVLKKNQQGFEVDARYTMPQESGGKGWNASFSGGFGDLETDGFNVLMAYSHDRQDQLKATDRDFAKTGMINFKADGYRVTWDANGDVTRTFVPNANLYFFNGSGNAIPGNAQVFYNDANGVAQTATFNPYLRANGKCAPDNSQIGSQCFFDYTSTIEITPESDRDSLFGKASLKLGDWTAYVDAAASRFTMLSRIAPYPTLYFPINTASAGGQALINKWITPYLPAGSTVTGLNARWRSLPAGNREQEYVTDSTHFVAGANGEFLGWDIDAALTHSVNESSVNYPTGWLLQKEFLDTFSAGLVDVFGTTDQLTDADKAALAKTIYHGPGNTDKTVLKGISLKASRPLFDLPAGEVLFGSGLDFRQYHFTSEIADVYRHYDAASDSYISLLLNESAQQPYDLERDTAGVFGELIVPVTDQLELNGAVRYDSIGKVRDNLASKDVNGNESDVTYKTSFRFQPSRNLMFRGSYGTGFKMPSMLALGRPITPFGVTSGNYACSPELGQISAALLQACQNKVGGADPALKSQHEVFNGGNPDLKPEKSEQMTVGFRFEPTTNLSVGLDWWRVKIEDALSSVSEAQIFGDPLKYASLFSTKRNTATGLDELAILDSAINIGKTDNRGIDWDLTLRNKLPFGRLTTRFAGTYLLKSSYTLPGSSDEFTTSLGQFGINDAVSFRTMAKLSFNLQQGALDHNLAVKYRSGYTDQFKDGENDCSVSENDALGDCFDVQLEVPSYTTVDWQTKWAISKQATATFGVNNLFDRAPSLSLRSSGAGHQVGYDPRYTDSYGRTFYIAGGYKF